MSHLPLPHRELCTGFGMSFPDIKKKVYEVSTQQRVVCPSSHFHFTSFDGAAATGQHLQSFTPAGSRTWSISHCIYLSPVSELRGGKANKPRAVLDAKVTTYLTPTLQSRLWLGICK